MRLLHGFDPDGPYRGGYVSIGNFDGVHRGHQAIITQLVERAQAADAPSVVITFDPHPVRLLRPEHAPPNLTTLETKTARLQQCGVDYAVVMPTTRDLLSLTPLEFFDRVLVNEFAARGVVEGPNFCFGKDRAGDIDTLRGFCEANGMTLDVVQPVTVDGILVSSSEVRRLISEGDMAAAVRLLGHPHRVQGHVERGAGRGNTLGFPTANLTGIETLLPRDGVYAGFVDREDRRYAAAVHLGGNPTFGEAEQKVEVHLVGFSDDLYGQSLAVDLIDRIRDVREFADRDALQEQLAADVRAVQERVANA